LSDKRTESQSDPGAALVPAFLANSRFPVQPMRRCVRTDARGVGLVRQSRRYQPREKTRNSGKNLASQFPSFQRLSGVLNYEMRFWDSSTDVFCSLTAVTAVNGKNERFLIRVQTPSSRLAFRRISQFGRVVECWRDSELSVDGSRNESVRDSLPLPRLAESVLAVEGHIPGKSSSRANVAAKSGVMKTPSRRGKYSCLRRKRAPTAMRRSSL
jgi:hypothetical protein